MVCLWLSLFFSSSFRACTPAMRRSSSWKRQFVQSECCSIHDFWIIQERGTTKDAARKTVLYTRSGPLWRMGEILTPSGCITGLSVWFSVSDQLSPAVGESQNSQNATLPAQSECASWEMGDIQLCVTSWQRWCLSLINRGKMLKCCLTVVNALMSATGDRLRCQARCVTTLKWFCEKNRFSLKNVHLLLYESDQYAIDYKRCYFSAITMFGQPPQRVLSWLFGCYGFSQLQYFQFNN